MPPTRIRRQRVARAFGAGLRAQRNARHLSQDELARRAGVSRDYLSRLERGLRVPNLLYIIEVAEGLGMDPEEVIAAALAELQRQESA